MDIKNFPPEVQALLQTMNQEIRDNLCTAVEIGKWPDGNELNDTQRADAMQAVMFWDSLHGDDTDEPFKVMKGGKLIRQVKKESSNKQPSSDNDNIDIRWQ
jgi:uncharacterized protein YeaC (DUF1315 family)